jgi:hypothetical protein
MGDVILTQEDIVMKREFDDGCVPSTWSIDLHYAKKQYAQKFPDDPFISIAVHDRRIDRSFGYPVPYRCFYSRNIENLFMAGRCISVTHEALGTTRVMKTCGMMGEVVGRAASICVRHNCQPRDVYTNYWGEMDELLKLPGKVYRETVDGGIVIPDDALSPAGIHGPMTGLDPTKLAGIVIDDTQAALSGEWTEGTGLKGYVGWGYLYASADTAATVRFEAKAPATGRFNIRLAYQSHENRGSQVHVSIQTAGRSNTIDVNMTQPADEDGFHSLGHFDLIENETVSVVLTTENAGGIVHADALQILRVK